jgi:hypothetical protein
MFFKLSFSVATKLLLLTISVATFKKKSYPKFKKHSRSVEYKQSGWKVSQDRKKLTITDKTGIGSFKLIGSRESTSKLCYYG